VASEHNAFAYVFEGAAELGRPGDEPGEKLGAGHLAVFAEGDGVTVRTRDSAVRFLLLAARPFNEPMARYGPFVMNTEEQIREAFRDYREGAFAI
jgi:redox-sensitive bicupin YhaK (pirin superfamily)